MTPGDVLVWLIVGVVFGLISWRIGVYKGHPAAGWWLGFLVGIIGLVIIALIPRTDEAKVKARAEQIRIEETARQQAGYAQASWPPQEPWQQYPPPQEQRPGPLEAWRQVRREREL